MSHSKSNASVLVVLCAVLTGACGAGAHEDGVSKSAAIVASSEHAKYVGSFSFQPALGDNHWTMNLALPSGEPIAGARVAADARMAYHGHFSSQMPICADGGDGRYELVNLVFDMPGAWQVEITVDAAPGLDSFQVPVFVE